MSRAAAIRQLVGWPAPAAQEAPMTIPKDITYPTILTQADWRKKKSAKGSVGGEPRGIVPIVQSKIDTGLGAALAEAQTAWNAIEFKHLSMKNYEHDGPDYLVLEKA